MLFLLIAAATTIPSQPSSPVDVPMPPAVEITPQSKPVIQDGPRGGLYCEEVTDMDEESFVCDGDKVFIDDFEDGSFLLIPPSLEESPAPDNR